MNTQTVQNNWSDLKTKIKTRWSKFSESEIDGFRDNLDKMSAQIQKTYGIAKDQAEKEFVDFKKSLISIKDSTKANVDPVIQALKHPSSLPQAEAMVSEGGRGSVRKAV